MIRLNKEHTQTLGTIEKVFQIEGIHPDPVSSAMVYCVLRQARGPEALKCLFTGVEG